MAIQGFQKVKASRMCEASVVSTAHSTQMMFLPTLSTSSPNTGDMGAEMMYTMLQERKIIYWTLPESFGNSEARKKKTSLPKNPINLQLPKGLRTGNAQHPRKQWQTQSFGIRAQQGFSWGFIDLPHHKFILKLPKLSSFGAAIKLLLSLRKESLNTKIKPLRAFSFQCEDLFLIKNIPTLPSYFLGHEKLFPRLNAAHRRSQISSHLSRAQKYILKFGSVPY